MIELRWVIRKIPYGIEWVLQMRQWEVRIDASGAITPLPAPITWSDWQDVPMERE